MKNLRSTVLALGITALLLVSCAKGQTENTATQATSTQATDATPAATATTTAPATATSQASPATSNDKIGQPFANTVKITVMNSKPEIEDALEAGAKAFGSEYNVSIEIYETDSPGNTLAERYAAGDAPTIGIMDIANIRDLAAEKLVDLSDQPWADVGGRTMGAVRDGKIYGMPLTVEGMCLIYNKTAIEKTTGHAFDPTKYTSLDAFSSLLKELQAGGMKYPMVLNAEDWSIGQKGYQFVYDYQDGTAAGAISFLKNVHDGKTSFSENTVFNKVYDAFDLFIADNINHEDPLAADYDLNANYVADGEAAFWLNGTWAWPDFAPYAQEGSEYGICAFPLNDEPATQGKVVAGATKFAAVDKIDASEDQQKAAEMFLNWLVFSDEGQDTLVNKCGIVTAFKNIKLQPNNPFNIGLKHYIDEGMVIDGATYMPSDHRSLLAANMQAYMVGKMTRADIASKLDAYWKSHTPTE
ncbi:MAG: ABC transporter substrate-binding protein [Spirochaetia bacterium]|jgi:raffinose/stachyose/melibiose transport system substrate-binding protein|nr:ABC transporter substrate-binding protein [Spirochaetia bacterium]